MSHAALELEILSVNVVESLCCQKHVLILIELFTLIEFYDMITGDLNDKSCDVYQVYGVFSMIA